MAGENATMTANTGRFDPNSVWGVFGQIINSVPSGIAQFNQTEAEKRKASALNNQAKADIARSNTLKKLVPAAVAAVVVIVLALVIFRRR